jgi:hypothetical protein
MFFDVYKEIVMSNHPWKKGPSELVTHAIHHYHQKTDFDNRMSFLLFDVGLETILKTFVSMPEKISSVKFSFQKRKEAIDGGFVSLINIVEDAYKFPTTIDIHNVIFYHNIRNKIYHEGNGITVSNEILHTYGLMVVEILKLLIDVDLTDDFNIQNKIKQDQENREKISVAVSSKKDEIDKGFSTLNKSINRAVEIIEPKLLLPSFRDGVQRLIDVHSEWNTYYNSDGELVESRSIVFDPSDRVKFIVAVSKLLETTITDQDLKDKLFKLTEFDASFYHDGLYPIYIFASDFLYGRVEEDWYMLLRILQIAIGSTVESNDWANLASFYRNYPNVLPPEDRDKDNYVDEIIEYGNVIITYFSTLEKTIEDWISSKSVVDSI